jgi:hypothetical protein
LLLCHYGYSRLLNIHVKKWSLDSRPWDPSIHRRWHPAFHLEMGALRPPVVTLAERAGLWRVVGLSPGLFPFLAFSAEVSLLSIMAANSRCRLQLGGALFESYNEVIVLLSFSLLLVTTWL